MIGITATGEGAPNVFMRWGDSDGKRFENSYLHTFEHVERQQQVVDVSWEADDKDARFPQNRGIVTAWCVNGLGQIRWVVVISLLGSFNITLREDVIPEGSCILSRWGVV